MEYYPNGNLDDVIKRRINTLDYEERTNLIDNIIKSTCQGLIELYDNGIMHGNLKPTNILFNSEMNLFLSDYCYFFIDVLQSRSDLFASPEKMLQKQVGPKTDIWSFGNIIYYILTGFPVFHETNSVLTKYNNYDKIKDIIDENLDDDVKYKKLILKMLEYDPSDRIAINKVKEYIDEI